MIESHINSNLSNNKQNKKERYMTQDHKTQTPTPVPKKQPPQFQKFLIYSIDETLYNVLNM